MCILIILNIGLEILYTIVYTKYISSVVSCYKSSLNQIKTAALCL